MLFLSRHDDWREHFMGPAGELHNISADCIDGAGDWRYLRFALRVALFPVACGFAEHFRLAFHSDQFRSRPIEEWRRRGKHIADFF